MKALLGLLYAIRHAIRGCDCKRAYADGFFAAAQESERRERALRAGLSPEELDALVTDIRLRAR